MRWLEAVKLERVLSHDIEPNFWTWAQVQGEPTGSTLASPRLLVTIAAGTIVQSPLVKWEKPPGHFHRIASELVQTCNVAYLSRHVQQPWGHEHLGA